MKQKAYLIFCSMGVLFEGYLIIKNYSKEFPITTNVVLLIGFLMAYYVLSGKKGI